MGKEKKYSREELIGMFAKGELPTEDAFKWLINSNFNKADDKLDISEKLGLQIYPVETGQLLNFFEDADDEDPKYEIAISKEGLFLRRVSDLSNERDGKEVLPDLHIETRSGHIGIGRSNPKSTLDVDGIISSAGRLGTYKEDRLEADGHWHNVFEDNISGVHAFEVMAFAGGNKGNGNYSVLHAIVTCVFGKHNSRITKTGSQYKSRDRIEIRVVSKDSLIKKGKKRDSLIKKGNKDDKPENTGLLKSFFNWCKQLFEARKNEYNIQLRTRRNYIDNPSDSDNFRLHYKISLLWGPETHNDKDDSEIKPDGQLEITEEIDALIKYKELALDRNKDIRKELKRKTSIEKKQEEAKNLAQSIRDLQKLKLVSKELDRQSKLEEHHKGENETEYHKERIEKLNELKANFEKVWEKVKTESIS